MEPIPSVDLQELVSEASLVLLAEQKQDRVAKIKSLFSAIYELATHAIPKLERDLAQKKEQLAKKQTILEKLKAGDWTALATPPADSNNNNNSTQEPT